MKRCLETFIILLSALILNPPAFAQSPISGFNPASLTGRVDGVFIDGTAFTGNNAVPLQAIFFDEWEGPFNPANTNWGIMYWNTNAGAVYNGWRIAGFYRGEMFMEANRDTIEGLKIINLKEDLPVGRVFDIDMKARGFSASGIEASRGVGLERVLNGLSAGLTVRYLKGERIQEGTLKGNASATGPKSYDFNLFLDYVYDENYIYKRRNTIPGTGDGYSFDLGFREEFSRRFSAEILFRDLLGRIYWRDVPYTTADATSNVKSFDEDGYQVFRPTIRGYESYKDFTQKIPLKTDIVLSYMEGPFTLTPTVNFIADYEPLYWIDLKYRASDNVSYNAVYNVNYRVFSVGVAYKKSMLTLFSSDIDLRRANAVGLNLSLRYEW